MPLYQRYAHVIILAANLAAAAVKLDPSMHTIGSSVKGVHVVANTELELFSYNLGEPGVLTEQWFSVFGPSFQAGADPLVRVYYDGFNATPSLEFRLFMGHGMSPFGCTDEPGQMGCVDPSVSRVVPSDPNAFANSGLSSWGSELLGHGSTGGAMKNTYRIPFGAQYGIRVTLQLPFDGVAYYYCRGMTNYPVVVGDLQLPSEARLRLDINYNVTVQPHEYLTLVPRTSNGTAGLLFQVTLAASSSFIGFMEGCVRAYIDDSTNPGAEPLYLSSGTEDYFEGANFFDTGLMRSPQAGVTWVTGRNPGPYKMTAFKHHVRDPVVWWDIFELVIRNFDEDGVQCTANDGRSPTVPNLTRTGKKRMTLEPVVMSSYAWSYQWPAAS